MAVRAEWGRHIRRSKSVLKETMRHGRERNGEKSSISDADGFPGFLLGHRC